MSEPDQKSAELLEAIAQSPKLVREFIVWLEGRNPLPPPEHDAEPWTSVYSDPQTSTSERALAVGYENHTGMVAIGLFYQGIEAHRVSMLPVTALGIARHLREKARYALQQATKAGRAN